MEGYDNDACGAGFAFLIQSTSRTARGNTGGDLGYGNLINPREGTKKGYAAIGKSVIIEFDMKKSGKSTLDPNGNAQMTCKRKT